jgi:hypothetical protein
MMDEPRNVTEAYFVLSRTLTLPNLDPLGALCVDTHPTKHTIYDTHATIPTALESAGP